MIGFRSKMFQVTSPIGLPVMDLRDHLSPVGLIPPVDSGWPSSANIWSPYPIGLRDFASLTGYTAERRAILKGFFELRRELKRRGITGVQWIDGSFLEHEDRRGRPPGDLDVVTWMVNPEDASEDWPKSVLSGLPPGQEGKNYYRCDIYFDICNAQGLVPTHRAAYWLGLFGHTRSGEWKGFFQVPLDEDEDSIMTGGADAIQG